MPRLKYRACPKCNETSYLTKHHILPRRHFGGGKRNNGGIVKLCRRCHDTIESMIPLDKQPIEFYYGVLINFGLYRCLT